MSVSLSIYLRLTVGMSNDLSVYVSVCLSIYPSVYLSIYLSLSHIGLLSLLRCPEWSEKEREKEKERKRGVSNSSDRGTPQTKHNCLLHYQPMAIPASSPLNMKHRHNVHTIRHFSITGPQMMSWCLMSSDAIWHIRDTTGPHRLIWLYMGITTVTTTDTPSYLHVAMSDNCKASYKQKADKRDTDHRNYSGNENRYDYAGYLACSPPPHRSR